MRHCWSLPPSCARLSARRQDKAMRMDYERVDSAGAGKRSLLSIVLLPLIAFVAGVAAMGWLLVNWDAAASYLGVRPAAPPAPIEAVRTTVTQVDRKSTRLNSSH